MATHYDVESMEVALQRSKLRLVLPVTVRNIDFSLLRQQQELLIEWLDTQPNHLCWGLVHLIDAIQDAYEDLYETEPLDEER